MIEHNSEVTITPTFFFHCTCIHIYIYMEEDLWGGGGGGGGGGCILHCYVQSSLLFPYILPFWSEHDSDYGGVVRISVGQA